MTIHSKVCEDCGKRCINFRKGWQCATRDKFKTTEYLRARKEKCSIHVERGWIHVHCGLPYSNLFGTKQECLNDIEYKSNNSPMSRARYVTVRTIMTWK